MFNCLIWGSGKVFTNELQGIRYLELTNQIKVSGITSNVDCFSTIAGYPYVPKDKLQADHYDIVFIMADGSVFNSIVAEAASRGFDEDILVHHRVIHIINNNLDKYLEIKKRHVTIFANNCWGGFTYHMLGLEFLSPLINMAIPDEDYIKFLENPQKYIDGELYYTGNMDDETISFPTAKCEDTDLYFVHYETFEKAKIIWDKRKTKINWESMLVVFSTDNLDLVKHFLKLKYEHKICFSPFELEGKECVQIDLFKGRMIKENYSFATMVANLASEQYQYLDLIDLLYDGTITKLSQE